MKVLQVNKAHHRRGGANLYCLELSRVLEEAGHRVVHFSMKDAANEPCPDADLFVEHVDFDEPGGPLARLHAFGRVIYSPQARRRIGRLVERHRPDIAHLHNVYHQISPSILPALHRRGIPVLLTAHDYKLVCPNYTLFDGDRVCERCLDGQVHRVATTGCHGGSVAKGVTLAFEAFLHRLLGTYVRHLDHVVAPGPFMRDTLVRFGFPADRITVIPNFVDPLPDAPDGAEGDYILYFGRLSREKGLMTLVQAMRRLPGSTLIIAGDGPERGALEAACGGEGPANVRFLGHRTPEEVRRLVGGSRFTVLPSIWYENCPLSVLESMARGRPVVGARIGGIPDLIEDGRDGLLFAPGDADDLAEKIERLEKDGDLRRALGRAAFRKVGRLYSREVHVRSIVSLYERLIGM
jgi:glycosyltransferase involved in cell wall biosynthesis